MALYRCAWIVLSFMLNFDEHLNLSWWIPQIFIGSLTFMERSIIWLPCSTHVSEFHSLFYSIPRLSPRNAGDSGMCWNLVSHLLSTCLTSEPMSKYGWKEIGKLLLALSVSLALEDSKITHVKSEWETRFQRMLLAGEHVYQGAHFWLFEHSCHISQIKGVLASLLLRGQQSSWNWNLVACLGDVPSEQRSALSFTISSTSLEYDAS